MDSTSGTIDSSADIGLGTLCHNEENSTRGDDEDKSDSGSSKRSANAGDELSLPHRATSGPQLGLASCQNDHPVFDGKAHSQASSQLSS